MSYPTIRLLPYVPSLFVVIGQTSQTETLLTVEVSLDVTGDRTPRNKEIGPLLR